MALPSMHQQAVSLNRDKILSKVRLNIRGGSEDRGLRTWEVKIRVRVSSAPIPASRRKRKILALETRLRWFKQLVDNKIHIRYYYSKLMLSCLLLAEIKGRLS